MRRGYKVGDQVVRHALVGVVDTVPDASDDDAGITATRPASRPQNQNEDYDR